MDTNSLIIDFVKNNYLAIILILFSILKIVPPEWAGFWKYVNNKESEGKAVRITLLNLLLTNFLDSVIRSFFIPLLAAFGLKNMITLIIFLVVGFDIFFRGQTSTQAVTLVAVGIIALYLDILVETGKKITFFGGLLRWERKDKSQT